MRNKKRGEIIIRTINENKMTRTEWLMKFRRCQTIDTLEKVYEHLRYTGDAKEELAMTQAYDHRKAEFAAGKLFDRVPKHVWQYVK
ncbi:Hha/YmoA family nucleoid-associated regulatory protein [Erwinia amylovora]|uniref:Hha/YmoA family nucleoid-associated regulatory protein n=1 Tax=Erwinia amylovora TaxID=552 RepID=UPI001F047F10|nr:Hha/YmoA family nucleoid-associated regulatory protein [Erwinia amylovora]